MTGVYPYTWLIFVFFVEVGCHHVAQAGLKLLGSRNPPASAPKVLGLQVHPARNFFSFYYLIYESGNEAGLGLRGFSNL